MCNKALKSVPSLKRHILIADSVHWTYLMSRTDPSLEQHYQQVLNNNTCDKCRKSFRRKATYDRHVARGDCKERTEQEQTEGTNEGVTSVSEA